MMRGLDVSLAAPAPVVRGLLGALLTAAILIAFWPTGDLGFVFDDEGFIARNRLILDNDVFGALFGRQQLMGNRPLVNFALALQHLCFGDDLTGYRWVSVGLHLVNAWLVFVVVQGTLRSKNLAARFSAGQAFWIAAAVTALWSLHPLTVDAAAYISQQSMLMMAAAALTAVRMLQLDHEHPGTSSYRIAAVACLALGMACKEELAPAPLLLLLYERAFLLPDWRSLRPRAGFYLALAATWLVLAYCITGGGENGTVGYDTTPRSGPFDWLMTQSWVVVHYARSVFWPSELRGYYDHAVVTDPAAAAVPGCMVLGALALTIMLWPRRPWWGFAGALFFLQLAPTSSILPIPVEVVAERRMYLPMLGLVVPAMVALGWSVRSRRGGLVALAIGGAVAAIAEVAVTRQRVAAYANSATYWRDAYERNELVERSYQAGMVLTNYGQTLRKAGDLDGSLAVFRRALDCVADNATDRLLVMRAAILSKNYDMAEPLLLALLAGSPSDAVLHHDLAMLLIQRVSAESARLDAGAHDPRLLEALASVRRAAELDPRNAGYANTQGWLLVQVGRAAEAEPHYKRAIELEPKRLTAWFNLHDLLVQLGRRPHARDLWTALQQNNPDDVSLRAQAAQELAQRGDFETAKSLLLDALRLQPNNREVQQLLALVVRTLGQ